MSRQGRRRRRSDVVFQSARSLNCCGARLADDTYAQPGYWQAVKDFVEKEVIKS